MLIGLLQNPKLSQNQFDSIYTRLVNGLAEKIYIEDLKNNEGFFEDYLYQSPFITEEQKDRMMNGVLEEIWESLVSQGRS